MKLLKIAVLTTLALSSIGCQTIPQNNLRAESHRSVGTPIGRGFGSSYETNIVKPSEIGKSGSASIIGFVTGEVDLFDDPKGDYVKTVTENEVSFPMEIMAIASNGRLQINVDKDNYWTDFGFVKTDSKKTTASISCFLQKGRKSVTTLAAVIPTASTRGFGDDCE
ncbi:hypothetical protein [Candidatus Albibeggiatoa sp. nov. BB20]|uniref:hypothetical protein n=1 Tax=Candidatus Albibeggiatoa sp. nov. BB20 TaxID=3162723 RepID=UPI0033656CF3